jgi:alcohol dehydrogenase
MVECGYAQEAGRSLKARRMEAFSFHDFSPDPTAAMVEAGAAFAKPHNPNLIVALGGGSSMDCAKAVNFVASNGGRLREYWGYGKSQQPMLPMIAVPTTAGTGSEAQSYATITDQETRVKMACGDAKVAFRVAILDPRLTLSQPARLTAATGYDALSHALETLVSTRRTALSDCFSRSAWRLVNTGFERVLSHPEDLEARSAMLLGSHFGGLAIENSMLGAAHACAHPLTSNFGIPHGIAIGLVLASAVQWNREVAEARYQELYPGDLAARLKDLAARAELPSSLSEMHVPEQALPRLAEDAASQWTGRFNPRPFDAAAALEIYRAAY